MSIKYLLKFWHNLVKFSFNIGYTLDKNAIFFYNVIKYFGLEICYIEIYYLEMSGANEMGGSLSTF
ncbi:MAG: hypothetical protein PWQ94_772 [Thermoanaerobacterium sp.]|nr:hypothetical protein [Thermoanaerobacterium sp.]